MPSILCSGFFILLSSMKLISASQNPRRAPLFKMGVCLVFDLQQLLPGAFCFRTPVSICAPYGYLPSAKYRRLACWAYSARILFISCCMSTAFRLCVQLCTARLYSSIILCHVQPSVLLAVNYVGRPQDCTAIDSRQGH